MGSVGQDQGQNRCVPADSVRVCIKPFNIYIYVSVFTSLSVMITSVELWKIKISCLKENYRSCF